MTIPYKQHVFKTDGIFTVAHTPPGAYMDVLLVGAGAGGYRGQHQIHGFVSPGGAGGSVVYQRIYINLPRSFRVVVGKPSSLDAASSITNLIAAPGGISSVAYPDPNNPSNDYLDSTLGTLITDGLFYDNTVYYGGTGASLLHSSTQDVIQGNDVFNGGAGGIYSSFWWDTVNLSALLWNGYDGAPNTGGGGASGQETYARVRGVYGIPGSGGSGIVTIRYPIIN